MRHTPSGPVTIQCNTADLRRLSVSLARVEPKLRVLLRREIVKAGAGARDAVRQEASWSSRIPASVKVKVSFAARGTGVTVVADAKKAPEARVLEHGGHEGTFRHPVHADPDKLRDQWSWVKQDARPFFFKAVTHWSHTNFQGQVEKIAEEIALLITRT